MRYLLTLLAIAIMVYASVDCRNAEPEELRGRPRALWLLVIGFVPVLGALLWLSVSVRNRLERSKRANTPAAPDDDLAFLLQLERQRRLAAEAEVRRGRETNPGRIAGTPGAGAGGSGGGEQPGAGSPESAPEPGTGTEPDAGTEIG